MNIGVDVKNRPRWSFLTSKTMSKTMSKMVEMSLLDFAYYPLCFRVFDPWPKNPTQKWQKCRTNAVHHFWSKRVFSKKHVFSKKLKKWVFLVKKHCFLDPFLGSETPLPQQSHSQRDPKKGPKNSVFKGFGSRFCLLPPVFSCFWPLT